MRFEGKTAIISGGARGQGALEAALLVAEGGQVLIGDVLEDEGKQLAAELGPNAAFARLDVTSESDWQAAVAQTEEELGPLNLLVNNAGILQAAPIIETSVAMFELHMRVNQLGVFLGMKSVFESMRRAGGGSIVNISSVAGLRGTPNAVAYSGSKWAVRGMTKVAAAEFGPHKIRVNSVHPGLIRTKLTDFTPDEQFTAFEAELPLGELNTIADVASAVLYLLSDDAVRITGAELKIDSGVLL